MSVITLDNKNRIRIPKKITKIAGLKSGDKILIFATFNRVFLVPLSDKNFVGSLDGINFNEEEHEAQKYLLKEESTRDASN